MPSSRARTRASRETCFSALSWSSAPTKSRLMGCLLLSLLDGGRVADTKKRGLVTHAQRRPCVVAEVYTGARGRLNRPRPPKPSVAASSARRRRLDPGAVARLDVVLEEVDEVGDDPVAAERPVQRAVHEHGSYGRLERAGEADPDVRVLRLAGPVDHAAHHGDLHVLDARVRVAPFGHPPL